jgi:excisionase family DNA binding protein
MRGHSRRAEPRIVDPVTHPRRSVGLGVAAAFLEVSPRTVKARIDAGKLCAYRDGRIYRIALSDLLRYKRAGST